MFSKLKRFFQGEPPPIAAEIMDPILGKLTWSKDDEAWLTDPKHQALGFSFHITGTPEPDKTLLAHAADILHERDQFIAKVMARVKQEGEQMKHLLEYQNEIAGLSIETVSLFWADRPNDGMISLAGGQDYRLWRIDLKNRQPEGLGFDS